jgi:hypothetical protein
MPFPDEPLNQPLAQLYDRLLAVRHHPAVRQGTWQWLDGVPAWDGHGTWDGVLACAWDGPGAERLWVTGHLCIQPESVGRPAAVHGSRQPPVAAAGCAR